MSKLSSVFAVTRLFARTLVAMTLAASFSVWSVVAPAADEVLELGHDLGEQVRQAGERSCH